jgi:hypothetical protein
MFGQQDGYQASLQAMLQQLRREFDQKLNQYAGGLRKHNDDNIKACDTKLTQAITELSTIAKALEYKGSVRRDPGTIRIEDIPGRRVPFDMLVDIAIGSDVTSTVEQSFTISQDGPFVAVKRVMAFQSALEFQVTDPVTGNTARFPGRSYGRYRPIHSAYDLMDSQHNAVADTTVWFNTWLQVLAAGQNFPGGVLALPSAASSFRTMEFDGRVTVINAGSGYPRQRIEVPTTMWTTDVVSGQDLGALDFFERGETVTMGVVPNHVHNPPAGNVAGDIVFPQAANVGFPFIDGQYDPHEGIATPGGVTSTGTDAIPDSLETDAVQRLPEGIVTIGFIGYRIIQSPGVAL